MCVIMHSICAFNLYMMCVIMHFLCPFYGVNSAKWKFYCSAFNLYMMC